MGGSSTASSVARWCPLLPMLVVSAALGLGCGGGGDVGAEAEVKVVAQHCWRAGW